MSNAVNAAIATALGTTAYHLRAPEGASLPYGVWNWQAGGLTSDHDVIDGLEWVRAYGTSAYQAGTLYAAYDATLNGGTLTISGYTTVGLRREDEFEFVEELPNGQMIYTTGGYYRLIIDA